MSSSVIFAAPLTAPTTINAIPGDGQVTLNWSAVTGAKSYNIYRGIIAGNETLIKDLITGTQVSIPDVNDTHYFFTVKAINAAGEESQFSERVLLNPIIRMIQVTTGRVMLTWPVVSAATTYEVYDGPKSQNSPRLDSLYFNLNKATNEIYVSIPNLTTTATHYFTVKAINATTGFTSSFSNEVGVMALSAPPTPFINSAVPDRGQVILSWLAVIGATSYNVYQGNTAGGEAIIPKLTGITGNSVVISNLTNGIPYFFKIKAVNAGGESAFSNEVSATPVNPDEIVVNGVTLTIGSSTLIADGKSRIFLRAQVVDIHDQPAIGVKVQFSTGAGNLFSELFGGILTNSENTDSNGDAQLFLQAPTRVGKTTVWVNANGLTASQDLEFVAGNLATITLNAMPSKLNSRGESTIEATVLDANKNPVADEVINFSINENNSGGKLNQVSATTDNNGRATVIYTAGAVGGTDILLATALRNGKQGTLKVGVTAAMVADVKLTTGANSVIADGESTVTVRATVTDIDGNPAVGVSVNFSTTAGKLPSRTVVTTNAKGVAEVLLSAPTRIGIATITSSVSGFSATAKVNFSADKPSQVIFNVTSLTIRPNETSTIEATVLDANKNPVADEVINFSISPNKNSGSLSDLTKTTDDNGRVVITYTAGTANGEYQLRARLVNGKQNAVDVSVTSPVAVKLSLSTSKVAVKSDNSDSATITAMVLDSNNAVIPDIVVTFSTTGGQISSSTVTTDKDGKATVIFSAGEDPINPVVTVTVSTLATGAAPILNAAIPIQIIGNTLRITTLKTSLPSDGSQISEVDVLVMNAASQPIANALVCFEVDNSAGGNLTLLDNATNLSLILCPVVGVAGVLGSSDASKGQTDVAGHLRIKVAGSNPGKSTLIVRAAGATAQQDFTLNTVNLNITAPEKTSPPLVKTTCTTICTSQANIHTVTVTANAKIVTFRTSLGTWQTTSDKSVVNVPVVNGSATAYLTSDTAGSATILVYDQDHPEASDSILLAFSASPEEAAKFLFQATPQILSVSTSNFKYTSTLTAILLTREDLPVANAMISFTIRSGSGTGETISPLLVVTDSSGQATTTFTAGTRATSSEGVKIQARVLNPDSLKPLFTKEINIVIANQPGSLIIGTSNQLATGSNNTIYTLPMTVLIADINGNPVANTDVTLSAWPIQYYTGVRDLLDNDGIYNGHPVITDTFQNEDKNENVILNDKEDFNGDNHLTPPNSAAGSLPRKATTDEFGVASFSLNYPKSSAQWVVDRIRASTQVQGSEVASDLIIRLPAVREDVYGSEGSDIGLGGTLRDSPYNVTCPYQVKSSTDTVYVAPGDSNSVTLTLTGIKGIKGIKEQLNERPITALIVKKEISSKTDTGAGTSTSTQKFLNPQFPLSYTDDNGQFEHKITIPNDIDFLGHSTTIHYFVSCAETEVNLVVSNQIIAGKPATLTITAQSTQVVPNGDSLLSAAVLDDAHNPIAGQRVNFTFLKNNSGASLPTASAQTNLNGIATITYTAGATAGKDTIVATTTSETAVKDQVKLTVNPAFIVIKSIDISKGTDDAVPVGGTVPVNIRATLLDINNQPASGLPVVFTTTAGSFQDAAAPGNTTTVITDSQGLANIFLLSGNVVGTATVIVNANGFVKRTTIDFSVGAPSSVVLNVSPNLVTTLGGTARIVVTVLDAYGNGVGKDQKVKFSVKPGIGSITLQGTTDDNSQAQATYTAGATAGKDTIIATLPNGVKGKTSITVSTSAAMVGTVTLATNKAILTANGVSQAIVSATVKDPKGVALQGKIVTFTTKAGTLSAASSITNTDGQAQVTLTAPTDVGSTTISANVDNVLGNAEVQFVAGAPNNLVVTLAPTLINPLGLTRVTATVKDAIGNLVSGTRVTFALDGKDSGGRFAKSSAITNIHGEASVQYTAGNTTIETTEALRVSVANNPKIMGMAYLSVAPGAVVVDKVELFVKGTTLPADGKSSVILRATVTDNASKPAEGVTVTFSSTAGTVNPATALTNDNGIATATLIAPSNLSKTFQASITAMTNGVISAAQNVTFTVIAVESITVTTVLNLVADGKKGAVVKVIVRDQDGNVVRNSTVTFATTNGTLSATNGVTDESGTASVFLTAPTHIGSANITATVGDVSGNTAIQFVAGPAANVVLSAAPAKVSPTATATLTATVKDAQQNPVKNDPLRFSITTNNSQGSLSSSSATTDENGIATVIYTAGIAGGSEVVTDIVTVEDTAADLAKVHPGTTNIIVNVGGPIIMGTAATGAPFADAMVTIKDSTAPIPQTVNGVTSATGTYRIDVTGMKPPFMLAAGKGSQYLFSILPEMATKVQNVNITPFTTLVMYELSMKIGITPTTMYQNGAFSGVTVAEIVTSQNTVRNMNALAPALVSVDKIFDMMYDPFTATGERDNTGYDTALDTLGTITDMSISGVTLLSTVGTTTTYTVSSGTAGIPSITLALRNSDDTDNITSIDSSTPALVKATVSDANGNAVAGAIVTFSTDPIYGSLSASGAALTNDNGIAKIRLSTSNITGGAATITAKTTVSEIAASSSINYSVGASSITLVSNDGSINPCEASIDGIAFGVNPVSAYGTTSVAVAVCNGTLLYTTPITVNFESNCAANGKANLTSAVSAIDGIASASYRDNGCNNPTTGDAITASLSNGNSVSGNLPVESPSLGSIQFISVVTNPATTPLMITLKGTGGFARSETANVTFRVVDSNGNAVGGQTVDFSLNTEIGGLALGNLTAISDPSTGNVITTVKSGMISTVVRVIASTGGLSTQSDQLVISTGIPAQDSISLSVTEQNIEGGNFDGTTTTFTVRLADHFHNPVPDGTAVYFTSEGGSITPSCTTIGGACSGITLTSQNFRPKNGRVTVLATAVGEEAFIDLNGNGTVDDSSEMIDANQAPIDIPEAYVDYDESGTRETTEPFFDFNNNNIYDEMDGQYNGILCTLDAEICSPQKSIHVRDSRIIIFSTSTADITINDGAEIALLACSDGTGLGASTSFTVNVVDQNGNAMPAGTTVQFTSDNGTITSSDYIVPNIAGCLNKPDLYPGCPIGTDDRPIGTETFGNINVTMKSDSTYDTKTTLCTNANGPSGNFVVTVTTPKNIITTKIIAVTD